MARPARYTEISVNVCKRTHIANGSVVYPTWCRSEKCNCLYKFKLMEEREREGERERERGREMEGDREGERKREGDRGGTERERKRERKREKERERERKREREGRERDTF